MFRARRVNQDPIQLAAINLQIAIHLIPVVWTLSNNVEEKDQRVRLSKIRNRRNIKTKKRVIGKTNRKRVKEIGENLGNLNKGMIIMDIKNREKTLSKSLKNNKVWTKDKEEVGQEVKGIETDNILEMINIQKKINPKKKINIPKY